MIFYVMVRGDPTPQGSKQPMVATDKAGRVIRNKATGRPVVTTVDAKGSRARIKTWRADVVDAAVKALAEIGREPGEALFTGPVQIAMTFTFARPKAHYGTGRNARALKPSAPDYPDEGKPGDWDKLARSTGDALATAGVLKNDKQIVDGCRVAKVYTLAAHTSGRGTWSMPFLAPAAVAGIPNADAMNIPGAIIRIAAMPPLEGTL